MAKDVERLVLELSADVSRLERGMRQGQRIAENRTRAIEKSFDQMNRRTTASVNDMGANIRNAIAGIAVGAAVREVQQYADAWTRMGNPLRAAGADQATVNAKMEEMVGISLRSRSSLEGTVTLYNRLIASSGELGVSQERVARVVETVNKALATSNLSTGERTSAITQLAQGLGSGTLAGDELKAIRENSIVLAQAIANEFDTTIGGLKKLGEEGVLTSARVFAAIENAQAGTDAAFARTTATVSDSFTNLQTRATQFIGQLDQATGASAKFAETVNFVANNLDAFGDAAVVAATVVGGVLAGRAVAAAILSFAGLQASIAVTNAQLVAFEITSGLATGSLGRLTIGATAAAGASRALGGALALVGGPVGIAVAAVATAFVGLALEVNAAKAATERYNDILQENAEVLAEAAALSGTVGDQSAGAVSGINAMCDATGRLSDETWELVDAQKEAIRTRLANAIDAIREERRTIGGNSLRRGLAETLGRVGIGAGDAETQARLERLANDQAALMSRYIDLTIVQNNERRRTGNRGGGGGGGGGAAGRGSAASVSEEAREVERLRGEVDRLAYEILSDTEKAAVDLAKVRDTLRAAVEIGRLTPAQAAALEGGFAAQGMTLTGDASLNPLDNNAGFLAEQLSGGRAATQKRFDEQGQEMARGFIEILSADDIGTEIGNRFRAAAFDGLEKVLGNLFSQLFASQGGGAGGGNIWAAAASAIFGGNRALGGPVRAGMAYRVNENTPNSEIFVPNRDGWVGNMKQPRGGGRSVQNVTVTNELYLAGANGDAVIYGNVRAMLAASQRQTVAAIKAGAPAAQLEQTLLRE